MRCRCLHLGWPRCFSVLLSSVAPLLYVSDILCLCIFARLCGFRALCAALCVLAEAGVLVLASIVIRTIVAACYDRHGERRERKVKAK